MVQTLGYSRNITLLLAAPPYLLCCIVMILSGLHSDMTQERCVSTIPSPSPYAFTDMVHRFWFRFKHTVYPLAVTVFAHILALSTTATGPRYLAMMLLPSSFGASTIVAFTWVSVRPSDPRALYCQTALASVLIHIDIIANAGPTNRKTSCCDRIPQCHRQRRELHPPLFSLLLCR